MSKEDWIAKEYRVEGRCLVINVRPSYGNRRKFEGEMSFAFTEEELNGLVTQIQDRKVKGESIKQAEAELEEFSEEVRQSFEEKRQEIADKFRLEAEEIRTYL
jgi:hypothetical protein